VLETADSLPSITGKSAIPLAVGRLIP